MKKYILYDYSGLGGYFTYILLSLHKIRTAEFFREFQNELAVALGFNPVFVNDKENNFLIAKCYDPNTNEMLTGKKFLEAYNAKIKSGFLFLALEEEVDNSGEIS